MRGKKQIFLGLATLLLLFLPGCWSNKDINQLNLVIAVGMDETEDGRIGLTTQLAKPAVIRARAQGGTGKAVWVNTSKGDTVFEAVRNQLTLSHRKNFYGHSQLIVIGEKLARSGFLEAMDIWIRDPEANLDSFILIAKGTTAKKILRAGSQIEDIPAIQLTEIVKNSAFTGKTKKTSCLEFFEKTARPGIEPVIGTVEILTDKPNLLIRDMRVEGAAVFRKGKLVGWLSPSETKGFLFAQNEFKSGIINIPIPGQRKGKVAIEVLRSSAKKDVKVQGGRLVGTIEIMEEGNIGEEIGAPDLTKPESVKKLEAETAAVIKREVGTLMRQAQEKYKTDIFGFGEIVHRKYPAYWKQVKNRWDDEFAAMPVEIKVTSKIRKAGFISKPVTTE